MFIPWLKTRICREVLQMPLHTERKLQALGGFYSALQRCSPHFILFACTRIQLLPSRKSSTVETGAEPRILRLVRGFSAQSFPLSAYCSIRLRAVSGYEQRANELADPALLGRTLSILQVPLPDDLISSWRFRMRTRNLQWNPCCRYLAVLRLPIYDDRASLPRYRCRSYGGRTCCSKS